MPQNSPFPIYLFIVGMRLQTPLHGTQVYRAVGGKMSNAEK